MIEFLQYIYSTLSNIHPSVYGERAPQGEPMPYITYMLGPSVEFGDEIHMSLYVDIWDNQSSTVAIEQLAEKVDQAFTRTKKCDPNFNTRIYRDSRTWVPDPDETIRRRQLKFTCMTMFKNLK